ncbi:hypothetical protein PINS_up010441 [Pythium insidiosum]|nr:hypothetical protein PINS_up010441 [Pythium insidiosum]
MKLVLKRGVKLPCNTYVIISVFIRPLEDGNENLRVQIYDSEAVEEFQYDFHDDHIRDYVEEWNCTDEEARLFASRLEFRREQGMIIIKMPPRIRPAPDEDVGTDGDDNGAMTSSGEIAPPATPPALMATLSTFSQGLPIELPPEPQYHLSRSASMTTTTWPAPREMTPPYGSIAERSADEENPDE